MVSVVTGYYGKLPLSPEFLRLRASGPEIRWLDEWLQRGVLYAKSTEGSRWDSLVAASPVWNFMLVPADSGRLVGGVLCHSHDRAGRSFPFLSFLLLDRDPLVDQPWLMPLMGAGYLDAMGAALSLLRQGGEWEAFQRQAEGWSTPLLSYESAAQIFDRYIEETPAVVWFERVYGCRPERIIEKQSDLIPLIVRSFNRVRGAVGGTALQMPLPSTSAYRGMDMSVVLALCLGSRSVSRTGYGLLAFWRQGPEAGQSSVVISLGPGSPHVLRAIVSPEAEDDAWRPLLCSYEMARGTCAPDGEEAFAFSHEPGGALKTLLDMLQ